MQKFRRHFSWFVSQLDEPVLVIVDDLDRCSPKYVVELVRGLLTTSSARLGWCSCCSGTRTGSKPPSRRSTRRWPMSTPTHR
ncbi:P-loop NTPase fold protein [Rhizobium beringeri]